MLTEFRERGRGERSRERNIDRLPLVHIPTRDLLFVPQWGPNPFTSYVPWLGIEPATFWITRNTPTEWATLARASNFFSIPVCLFYFIFYPHPRTCPLTLEKGEGRKRNIDVRRKHQLHLPHAWLGMNPQSRHTPGHLTGNWTCNVLV